MTWGFHLITNVSKCNPTTIRCSSNISYFVKDLVKRIDMKAYSIPLIVRFGEDDKMGYSLVQLIETSNITGHFCESTNDAYLDIFSCKSYDTEVALKCINDYFQPEHIDYQMIYRTALKETEYLK